MQLHLRLALAAPLLLAACTSGLGGFETEAPGEAASTETALGVDLGLELSAPVEATLAVAGARIPGANEGEERDVVLVAFVTAAAADDGDGQGTPLVRDAVPPTDDNDTLDVFLLALEDEQYETEEGGSQPVAFSRALVDTFRHSRCVVCHGLGTPTPDGQEDVFPGVHPGGQPVTTKSCTTCHSPANVPGLGDVEWRAPLAADGDFDFRGLSLAELAERARSVPIDEHLRDDGRIRWAIEVANVPFVPPQAGGNAGTSDQWSGSGKDRGAVPISFPTFLAQLEAWEQGGFQTTAAGSVRDVVLVSRVPAGTAAGNGSSSEPSITWVPDPTWTPGNTAAPAGRVRIAFASEATDLTGDAVATRNVFVTEVELFVGRDPADGSVSPGGLDLAPAAGSTVLVSRSTGGGGGDGDSDQPALDADGRLVAFRSAASDLVAGFVDGNGAESDVYLRDLDAATTHLVSASTAAAGQGGDGPSGWPDLSPEGGVVAFVSAAGDLVGDDLNGVADVFTARLASGVVTPAERQSVDSQGVEGTGGDCRDPEVVLVGERLTVVFESDKTDLGDPVDATTSVWLREDGRTTLLSQVRAGSSRSPADADSRRPTLGPTALFAAFDSEAADLDTQVEDDANGVSDVLLVDLSRLRSNEAVQPRRLSLDSFLRTTDGPSSAPLLSAYRDADGAFVPGGFALFRTEAGDLGAGRSGDLVAVFVDGAGAVVTDFAADPLVGPAPLTVTFTDLSGGEPLAWSWDLGDGDSSELQNPVHTYADPGTYDVTLVVTRAGGSETLTKTALVRALEPPVASFTADDTEGPAPHTVNFDSTVTGDLDELVYEWDFGDGDGSALADPTHVYADPGTYTVSLRVSGLAGEDLVVEQDLVTVEEPSGANFTVDDASGLRRSFNDQSTGSPTSWEWRVGGVLFSTDQNPIYDFPDVGTYSVTLSVDGPGGPSTSDPKNVIVDAVVFGDVYPMLQAAGCTGCHPPEGGMDLSSQAVAFAELLGAGAGASAEGPCCGGETRVVPFDATGSLLVKVLDPAVMACNDPLLCLTGAAMGTVSDLDLLKLWIAEGAAEGAP